MNLLEKIDKYLENPYLERSRKPSIGFYPSSASCKTKNVYGEDEMVGDCLRPLYWRDKNVKKSNPMTARGIRIARCGRLIEQAEIRSYKELGIWRDSNVKFFNPQYRISGEADALIHDEETQRIIGVEIKTGYDYKFRRQVIGNSQRKGSPKLDHLLQTMLYIDYFKTMFKIVYIDRGNAARNEFDITLNKDGTPNIDGKKLDNGLSIPGCIARYKELGEHLENGTLPRRDFELQYSQQKIQLLRDSNRLNKTQVKEFDKNKKLDIGDWQCSYCDYKDYCWKEHKDE